MVAAKGWPHAGSPHTGQPNPIESSMLGPKSGKRIGPIQLNPFPCNMLHRITYPTGRPCVGPIKTKAPDDPFPPRHHPAPILSKP